MKTLTTLFLFPFFLFLFTANAVAQTTYTWTGATDTDWSTTSNWSPTGTPSSSDYIVIETGTYDLQLVADKSVTRYKINSGTMDLNGYTLSVSDKVEMLGGTTTAGKIIQSATNVANINGATVNCKLDLTATTVTVQYSDFADSVAVHQTTASSAIYWRGNRFHGHLDIENTSNGDMNLGYNPADSCFDGLTLQGGRIRVGYAHPGYYIEGNLVIDDEGASGTYFAISGGDGTAEVTVDGHIIVDKTGDGSLNFAVTSGTCKLNQTSGHSIYEGSTGYTNGYHQIMGLTQAGSGGGISYVAGASTQEFVLDEGTYGPSIGTLNIDLDDVTIDGAEVNGYANVTAEHLLLTGNEFGATAAFTKTGSGIDACGGNVFRGYTQLRNESSSSQFRFGCTLPDTSYGSVLLYADAGQRLTAGYDTAFVAMGGVDCNSNGGPVRLGDISNDGTFVLAGVGMQRVQPQLGSSLNVQHIIVNKPSGLVRLTGKIPINNSLELLDGVILCVDSGMVSVKDGATVTGTSDNSYVEGPVEKSGDDAFSFPIGRNGIYQPLTISAPASTSHTFQAEYFDADSDPEYDHGSRVGSISYLDRTQYWTFQKSAGSTGVYVTLGWRDVDCGISSINDPDICAWTGSQWDNLGNASPTGSGITGTATSTTSTTNYGPYTWGNFSGIRADAGPDRVMVSGDTVTIGVMNEENWDYDWSPSGTVEQTDTSITRAYPTTKTEYVLEVTGENSCTATDTAIVFITVMPEDTARSSLDFVVNNGQIIDTDGAPRPDIGIYSHQASPMVYCSDTTLHFVHARIDTVASTPDTLARVDIHFRGTENSPGPLGMGLNSHHYNYYYAHCPDGVTLTSSYNRVVYPELYENTDLHITGNNSWMKFEFVIHPDGDPEDILMTFEGADNIMVIPIVDALVITSSIGTYVFPEPKALTIDTVGNTVELNWQPDWDLSVTGDTVRFTNIGSYDTTQTLVLRLGEELNEATAEQLGNLGWSTHFGGTGNDVVRALDLDSEGNLFAVGGTTSSEFSFPVFAGLYMNLVEGNQSAFVGKFEPFGTRDWVTYYGTDGTEALGVSTDEDGNLFVSGGYSNQIEPLYFPVQFVSGAHNQAPINVATNHIYGILIELNQIDGQRTWATVYGDDSPTGQCRSLDVAVDSYENIYITGYARQYDGGFLIHHDSGLPNAYQQSGTINGIAYGFLALFQAESNKLLWSTLFGTQNTFINDLHIAGERGGDILITGSVNDNDIENFPFEAQTNQISISTYGGGSYDAFVAQFDNASRDLVWSTLLGGDASEVGHAITYNQHNNSVYVCGYIEGLNSGDYFPLMDNMNSNSINDDVAEGQSEGFIARYEYNGEMEWATYFGGSGADRCGAMTVNPSGTLFITGFSEGDGFQEQEVAGLYFQEFLENTPDGGPDMDSYILALNPDDDLVWSSLFGGEKYNASGENGVGVPSRDWAWGIASDQQNVFIGGRTESNANFPWHVDLDNYPQAFHQFWASGSWDGFISQFVLTGTPLDIEESGEPNYLGLQVFPNPTTGQINVVLQNIDGLVNFNLFDIVGQKVFSSTSTVWGESWKTTFDLNGMTEGMYVLTVSPEFEPVRSVKIIID